MTWRVALSLLVLRDQIDALYPNRNKASDGTIGDAAHQAQQSDHNPDSQGIVRALDITHDPQHGCDIDQISDALAAAQDLRVSYVIANRLITGPDYGWIWTSYSGDDPHTGHLHLSVVSTSMADKQYAWYLPRLEGDEPMATTSEKIDAMMMGFPSTSDGDPVCPTRWQIQTEKFQAEVRTTLAEIKAQTTPSIDYEALAKALLAQIAK